MSDCILWQGKLDHHGYGTVYIKVSEAPSLGIESGMYRIHRLAYRLIEGEIPDGLVLDHLCHNAAPDCNANKDCPHRRCINVDHLEPTTVSENIRRGRHPDIGKFQREKTHCPRGHEYTLENTQLRTNRRSRQCKECVHLLGGFEQRRFEDRCPNGHPWEPATTYINTKGRKVCRICKRDRYVRDHYRIN